MLYLSTLPTFQQSFLGYRMAQVASLLLLSILVQEQHRSVAHTVPTRPSSADHKVPFVT